MRIQFDDTNLLAGVAGEADGLTRSELESSRPQALDALRAFQQRSESGEIGFPHLPFQERTVRAARRYADAVRGSYDTVCLVGIGGSALGAWALDCGIRGPHPVQGAFSPAHPRLVVLDNVDPAFIEAALASMRPRRTRVVVVAKSGSTAETVATFVIVRDWLRRGVGSRFAGRIAAVTSEGRGDLAALAQREQYQIFAIPENVGGRFSVLSAAGLVPAALIGLDIGKLARGAAAITHACWQPDLAVNLALRAALDHFLLWTRRGKSIHVAFPYSNFLWGAAFWFRQLWAESLGKTRTREGRIAFIGQTPVAALGTTDQHSQVQLYIEGPNDKVFTFWTVEKFRHTGKIPASRFELPAFDALAGRRLSELLDAERRSTAAALAKAHRPNCAFSLARLDEEHLGAFLQLLEFQTAFLGEMLQINAFDQEGVELGKRFTYALMGRPGFESYREQFEEYERQRAAAAQ